MIKSLTISACILCTAAPVVAQDLVFSMEATESCLAASSEASAQEACIGASAQMCMENTVGGQTTVGMGGCLDAELTQWDMRLNAAYNQLMAKEKSEDAEMAEIGSSAPKQAVALKEMQRAWIPYRDLRCAHVGTQWGGGTGTGPAVIGCLMQQTGEQALYLKQMLNY